ncbi:MAG: Rne/Rng family ribonuclease [Elusimicrobia bacterium]|nr:Rne/Rng family ribonuclease [Candidatus Obscuribacterium magneticum]
MKPIKRQILANSLPDEVRVAILEDGQLVEFFVDRPIRGSAQLVGNIYKGTVENVLPGISSAFVDVGMEKNAYLYITDVVSDSHERDIEKILKRGSSILVQVAKEAIGTKGMKVTMDLALPGRYIIFMPMSEHVGVSRQIESPQERDRLKRIIDSLNPPGGVIIRTEAEEVEERALRREMKYLLRLWDNIQKRTEKVQKGLVHRELGLTFQVVRDILSEDVESFLLDNRQEYEDVRGFVEMLAPELVERVHLYEGRVPIFNTFNVEQELQKLRQSRFDLPSGGYIVIQEAESLCAIDVNTGKFTGRKSQEETVTATNIEAAVEIARQLRIRNIGGIIVIDFIDMRRRRNREKVMEALLQATKNDHAKIKILPITRLGLVEMTRERRRESLQAMMGEPCTECSGSGWVLSRESLYLKIRKEILELTQGRPEGRLKIHLYSEIAAYFNENRERLEKQIRRSVEIIGDESLSWEQYRIVLE